MRGLVTARVAVLSAVASIYADIKKLAKASNACRRLMTIPGVDHLTALAFTAAVDDPERFRRSRDLDAYLGLVPRRYQSGEVDYTGGISKCGDRRMRTLLYEAANVILTRYKGTAELSGEDFCKEQERRQRSSINRSGRIRQSAACMAPVVPPPIRNEAGAVPPTPTQHGNFDRRAALNHRRGRASHHA